jgi:hypothetical protein
MADKAQTQLYYWDGVDEYTPVAFGISESGTVGSVHRRLIRADDVAKFWGTSDGSKSETVFWDLA